MTVGALWQRMNARPRRAMTELTAADVPESPGVYALYRGDVPMYVGKAGSLRDRVWKNHSGRGKAMTNSAMRRNVAEHLGIATANDIKTGDHPLTDDEVAAVRAWLDGCDIAWVTCETDAAAKKLEGDIKDEYRPPLTKR